MRTLGSLLALSYFFVHGCGTDARHPMEALGDGATEASDSGQSDTPSPPAVDGGVLSTGDGAVPAADAGTTADAGLCGPETDCNGDGRADGDCVGTRCAVTCETPADCAGLDSDCRHYDCLLGFCLPVEVTVGCTCEDNTECIAAAPACYDGICDHGRCAVQPVASFCDSSASSCEVANRLPPMTSGLAQRGHFALAEIRGGMRGSCVGTATRYLHVSVTDTSDIEIDVRIDQDDLPRHDPVGCEIGCTVAIGEPLPARCCPRLTYAVSLEATCGDPSSDVLAQERGTCGASGADFPIEWNGKSRFFAPRVPPGDYFVAISSEGGAAFERPFEIEADISPSPAIRCDGAVLESGRSIAASTAGGTDAIAVSCYEGAIADRAPERIHPFTVASRSRVRIEARTTAEPLRLRLLDECRVDAVVACRRSQCLEGEVLEAVLGPGTYYVAVEATSFRRSPPHQYTESDEVAYDIMLTLEPPEQACAGATALTGSTTVRGTTVGQPDRVRMPRAFAAWCSQAGLGDAADSVYTFELDAVRDVAFSLGDAFTGAALALYRDCGGEPIGGGTRYRSITTSLEAGRYSLFVGGGHAGEEGAFVLDVDLGP